MILSALLFLLAVVAYSLKELKSFGKLKWMSKNPYGFIGEHSDKRKYKRLNLDSSFERYDTTQPKLNWYYDFFGIAHREKFLLSATALSFLTDFTHLMQFFFKLLFCAAFYPLTNWWFPILLWCLWGICFTLCDKYLTK